MKIVREVILRCANCHCAVKVESTKIEIPDSQINWDSENCERLLFTVTKNAE